MCVHVSQLMSANDNRKKVDIVAESAHDWQETLAAIWFAGFGSVACSYRVNGAELSRISVRDLCGVLGVLDVVRAQFGSAAQMA